MLGAIIGWLLFGLIVGAIARLVVPGRDPMGWFATIALGIAGSFIGGFFANMLFGGDMDRMEPASFLGSLLGAVVLVLIVRRTREPRVSA